MLPHLGHRALAYENERELEAMIAEESRIFNLIRKNEQLFREMGADRYEWILDSKATGLPRRGFLEFSNARMGRRETPSDYFESIFLGGRRAGLLSEIYQENGTLVAVVGNIALKFDVEASISTYKAILPVFVPRFPGTHRIVFETEIRTHCGTLHYSGISEKSQKGMPKVELDVFFGHSPLKIKAYQVSIA